VGSGKTLLMHVNLLQYRHYAHRAGYDKQLSRVILLTPNERLNREELEAMHVLFMSEDQAGYIAKLLAIAKRTETGGTLA
jgi:hypothetical protein